MIYIKLKHLIAAAAAVAVLIAAGISRSTVQTMAPGNTAVKVPIIMYHSVLKHPGGDRYTVPLTGLESDLKYISENGYNTIVFRDLIDYVYEGTELPENPVILTFDDGFYNNYVYVYPLLKEYDARAVISIVGAYTDMYTENQDTNANYAYLTWDTAAELARSGVIEIQNHTYNMHSVNGSRRGCQRKSGESEEEYRAALTNDLGAMQKKCEEKLGAEPEVFTYPFGLVSSESIDIVKDMGFKASLSCTEGVNDISRDPEGLYLLKRCIRTPDKSLEEILRTIDN